MPKQQQQKEPLIVTSEAPCVDPVASTADLGKLAADEVFMNEPVTIRVHATTDSNQPPHLIVNCNGVNQPIQRGVPTVVKRKYVEILARMKEVRYQQRFDPREPDRNEMLSSEGLSYPFDLVDDKNPRGRAWLQNILAEPA